MNAIPAIWRAAWRRDRRSSCPSSTVARCSARSTSTATNAPPSALTDRELLEEVASLLGVRLAAREANPRHDTRDRHSDSRRRHRARRCPRRCSASSSRGRCADRLGAARCRRDRLQAARHALPVELLDSIRRNKVALKGPVTTPIGEGFTSVNVGLRKALDLYANVRPVWNIAGRRQPLLGRRPGHRPREHRGPLLRARARGGAWCGREPQDHHRAARRRGSRGSRSTTRGGTAARASPPSTRRTS